MADSKRILGPGQQELVRETREELAGLQTALLQIPADDEDEATLRASLDQLEEFFLLVVVGEFNAGKSALINALLGKRVLEEGVTPTTREIQVLRHAEQEQSRPDAIRTVPVESELLWDTRLVDTPGTNAIARDHEVLTRRFVPRADLVLFVTSADRPFSESERLFMESIRQWGKKTVIVINKADIMATPEDLERVSAFVRDNVDSLLAFVPDLFALSARTALKAKEENDPDALEASRFTPLEQYIRTRLDDAERFRLKLLNPLGVALRLSEKYSAAVAERLNVLREDVATVEQIRTQLQGYRSEMERGFELRLSEVDNLLHQFERRGSDFFEETVRIGRIFDLLNRDKVQSDFERYVVGDLPQQIESRVEKVIDWLVASDLQQWQEVRDRLVQRRTQHSEHAAGRLAGGFEYDRVRLLDTVGKAAQQTLEQHDQRGEAMRMADSVRLAVANAALLEVGAVGLGTAVSLIASSTAADVTGILAASLLATLGFFVLPYRRQNAKRELRQRIARLRRQLMDALTEQFRKETDRSARRVEEAIAPYAQLVEGERETLTKKKDELSQIDGRLRGLKARIETA